MNPEDDNWLMFLSPKYLMKPVDTSNWIDVPNVGKMSPEMYEKYIAFIKQKQNEAKNLLADQCSEDFLNG